MSIPSTTNSPSTRKGVESRKNPKTFRFRCCSHCNVISPAKETPTMATRYPLIPPSLCISIHNINSRGYFIGNNPLSYSTPLFLIQVFIATFASLATTVLLKPLGIPMNISQILAGVLLGPSCLGQFEMYLKKIFPFRSFIMLDTYGAFGVIFQIFLIGVQLNPLMVLNTGRKQIAIGFSVVLLPLVLSITCAFAISVMIGVDHQLAFCLPIVAVAESMSAFPIIASYLSELNILNAEFSRVAFSSSMISGALGFSLVGSILVLQVANNKPMAVTIMFIVSTAVILTCLFILRPLINWMIKRIPEGHTIKEEYLCLVFLTVVVLAWCCRYLGIDMLAGPFIFGIIIPSGPPLGSALVERLEYFNTWVIMPIYYTELGMLTNIFSIELSHILIIESVVIISWTGKFLGAFLPAVYNNMSYRDAVLLGLTMNVQGFTELWLFKVLKDQQLLNREAFEVMTVSIILMTGVLTPIVRHLHNTSMKYKLHNRRTIQHANPGSELRVLACMYDQENVPSIIHLLKATNPTKNSPIVVSLIHFVELVGRATPLVISHRAHKKPSGAAASSQPIINVFKKYEENNKGIISVHAYSVVSSYPSMHIDACMLALHKRTSLIILPYHKNLDTGSINGGIRTLNCNVLAKAPCSVGIVIDRGLLGGIKFVLANWLSYRVAVIFLGGVDDREALAYGTRMSEHPTIELTVFRFLLVPDDGIETEEKILDEGMIIEFKLKTSYNTRVTYKEEQVKNALGVINVIETMHGKYELIIMGRRHDESSPLILGLTEWNKCSEIGTMGDVFMTSEYGGKATILVVQQQSRIEERPRNPGQTINEQDEVEMESTSQSFDMWKEEEAPFRKDDELCR